MEMSKLPESCVASILCFTSPADTFSSASVSSMFRSAADSDYVWDKFLPSDYCDIISRSPSHLKFPSKKQLYRFLCEPLLIDNGQTIFKIEKFSGRKSYLLSPRRLAITMSDERMYWSWSCNPGSRFPEVAELITTDRLEIQGKIQTGSLSPNTKYGAYLIVKVTSRAFGLDLIPSEVSIKVGNNQVCRNTAYVYCLESQKQQMKQLMFGNREEVMRSRAGGGEGREPKARNDGWMEIELGDFESGEANEQVVMSLTEVKGYQLKGGLVVDGIEVRPKQQKENEPV